MTNTGYNWIVMVLKYGQINFWGGNNTLDFDDYRKSIKRCNELIQEALYWIEAAKKAN